MGDGKFSNNEICSAFLNNIYSEEDVNGLSSADSEIRLALEEIVNQELLKEKCLKINKEWVEEDAEEILLKSKDEELENSYSHFANYFANKESKEETAYNSYTGYKLKDNKDEYVPVSIEVQDRVEKQIDYACQANEWGFVYSEAYSSAVQEVQTKFYKATNMTFVWLVYELKENGHWGK